MDRVYGTPGVQAMPSFSSRGQQLVNGVDPHLTDNVSSAILPS